MHEQKSFVPGAGRYTVMVNGALVMVDNWSLIPAVYHEVIAFCPAVPETSTNHTDEEHDYLASLPAILLTFLQKAQNATSN